MSNTGTYRILWRSTPSPIPERQDFTLDVWVLPAQGADEPLAGLALAVDAGSAQDARAVLQASAAAMGANNVKTIQYTGTGWNALVGQSFNLAEDWPRFEVTSYTRTIDYDANVGREDFTRRRGSYPMRGGGAPFDGDQRVVQIVSGGVAWNMQGEKPVPPGRLYLELAPHADVRRHSVFPFEGRSGWCCWRRNEAESRLRDLSLRPAIRQTARRCRTPMTPTSRNPPNRLTCPISPKSGMLTILSGMVGTPSPHFSSGIPMTAACWMSGWRSRRFSISRTSIGALCNTASATRTGARRVSPPGGDCSHPAWSGPW